MFAPRAPSKSLIALALCLRMWSARIAWGSGDTSPFGHASGNGALGVVDWRPRRTRLDIRSLGSLAVRAVRSQVSLRSVIRRRAGVAAAQRFVPLEGADQVEETISGCGWALVA